MKSNKFPLITLIVCLALIGILIFATRASAWDCDKRPDKCPTTTVTTSTTTTTSTTIAPSTTAPTTITTTTTMPEVVLGPATRIYREPAMAPKVEPERLKFTG